MNDEISELEYQRMKKQSNLNSISMKVNIMQPVDNLKKLHDKLNKELSVKNREFEDI